MSISPNQLPSDKAQTVSEMLLFIFKCAAMQVVQHRCINCLVNCELYLMQYSQTMCFVFYMSKQL